MLYTYTLVTNISTVFAIRCTASSNCQRLSTWRMILTDIVSIKAGITFLPFYQPLILQRLVAEACMTASISKESPYSLGRRLVYIGLLHDRCPL
jgi:hypothetical protein